MSRRLYATNARLAELRWSLDELDWLLLRDVEAMRVAQATDLQALQDLRAELHVRSFRRRLQRLTEERLLERLDRVVGGRRAGSAGFVYILGKAGQQLLAAEHEQPATRRPWTPRPAWLAHALAVSRLYVTLRQAEAAARLKLVTFEAEPTSWRPFVGSHGTPTLLKPDAFVLVEQDLFSDRRFIEVDCGTESPATLARKFDVYWRYFQSGQEQLQHGIFPSVLWLAPTKAREDVLQAVAKRQPTDAQPLHVVSLYANANQTFSEEPP